MLKPWRPGEPLDLTPVRFDQFAEPTRNLLRSHTIEFVSLGFEHVGDYRLRRGDELRAVRVFQAPDGAVLGWIADVVAPHEPVAFASLLEDGTCVKSTAAPPHAPWSCCRFPVYVNFAAGCGTEDLLVTHLTSLAELEHGCGPTLRYAAHQVPEIFAYINALEHETEYGLAAPPEALPTLPIPALRELVTH